MGLVAFVLELARWLVSYTRAETALTCSCGILLTMVLRSFNVQQAWEQLSRDCSVSLRKNVW